MISEIHHVGATVLNIDWHCNFLTHTLSMNILSDSHREGEWIEAVTGLAPFQARNVYVSPDNVNRIEMFQIFQPPLVAVPLAYGTHLGLVHLGLRSGSFPAIAQSLYGQQKYLSEIREDDVEGALFVQDSSGLNWQLGRSDNLSDSGVRIEHIRMAVSSLERAMPVYAGLLALTPIDTTEQNLLLKTEDGRWSTVGAIVCRLRSPNNQVLHVCQYKEFKPLPNPRKKINCLGLHHIAFRVADAASIFASLRDFGCSSISLPQTIPMGPNRGGLLFYFYDLDGLLLEILQPPTPSK